MSYWINGIITSFKVVSGDENIEVWVRGKKHAPSDFPLHDAQEMAVVGTGDTTKYKFTTSGPLYPTENVETDGSDSVTKYSAEGTVRNYSDNYWFIGDIESFKVIEGNPNIDIWVSGKKYSPSDF